MRCWPRVAIVVLNWNGWQDTVECLESLQCLTHPNYLMIVVDNASTDGSADQIRAWARGQVSLQSPYLPRPGPKPLSVIEYTREEAERGGRDALEARLAALESPRRLVLIHAGANLGFAAGTNVGLRYALKAGFEYIGPLNNDTLVSPDSLTRLVATLNSHEELMAVSPKILYTGDSPRIFYAGGWLQMWRITGGYVGFQQPDNHVWHGVRSTAFASGAFFVAKRGLLESIGVFDEDFFFAFEEVAYSHVARKRGYQVGVDLDVVIHHKVGRSYKNEEGFVVYHNTKNRFLLLRKYGSIGENILGWCYYVSSRVVKFCLWAVEGKVSLIVAELRGIRDFILGRYGEYDRALANQDPPKGTA